MKFYIYALLDPNTKRVRYIGQTAYPSRRLYQHLYKAHTHVVNPSATSRWLKSLDEKPELKILEEVEGGCDPGERETWWMKEMRRRGEDLTNNSHTNYKSYRPRVVAAALQPERLAEVVAALQKGDSNNDE